MALDAMIFDVDGTLIDTNAHHVEAWRQAFEEHGFAIASDRLAPEIGKGGDMLVPDVLGASAEEEHGEALRESYGKAFLKIAESEHLSVFPDVRELLTTLRERGLKVAIATSAKQEYLDALQKSAGIDLESLVDLVVTADDAKNSKPAPDLVIAAVTKLGLSPAQCAMVGDTPHDAQACKGAGIVCLGVMCGGHSSSALVGAGAREVWRDPADLLKNLDQALETASPGESHITTEVLESLMRAALETAREGMNSGEASIGAVLARSDGTIIARGFNEMNASQNKTAHAEIVTFARAAGHVPLDARDLLLVSTLEPCVMCTGAAMEAAVDTIVYALEAPADNGSTRVRPPQSPETQMPRIIGGVLRDQSRALFQEWLDRNGESEQAAFVQQLMKVTEEKAK